MGFASSILSDISSPKNEPLILVTDVEQAITVLAPVKTIELHNQVQNGVNVYYGGPSLGAGATGIPILPGETKIFSAVENGFKVWVVCEGGNTAICRIVSYRGR